MTHHTAKPGWGRRLSLLALILSLGAVAGALLAGIGTGAGWWPYGSGLGTLRYALGAALAGSLLAIVAWIVSRRSGARAGWRNALALLVGLLFAAYLGNLALTARSLPMIHDATTNLDAMPQFSRLPVRSDNLDKVPDQGRPELAALSPEERWKALHRGAYSDLRPLRLAAPPQQVLAEAEALARGRGWAIAAVDPAAGTIEATATTLFFRFKDDVVIRVRPDPARAGGSIVDMRSISRVGLSDLGVNAKRIRAFLGDLEQAGQ